MPVLDQNGCCVGLIDAESWSPDFFDDARVATIASCALDIADDLAVLAPSNKLRWLLSWNEKEVRASVRCTVAGCAIAVAAVALRRLAKQA